MVTAVESTIRTQEKDVLNEMNIRQPYNKNGKATFIDIYKGNLTVFQMRAPIGINAACNCFNLGTTVMSGR